MKLVRNLEEKNARSVKRLEAGEEDRKNLVYARVCVSSATFTYVHIYDSGFISILKHVFVFVI